MPCPDGEHCLVDRCVPVCVEGCAENEVICDGRGTRTCGNFDADACRELGPLVPCPEGMTCSEGQCRIDCSDDCPTEGERACNQAADGYRTCGAFDPDGCLDWSSLQPCSLTERWLAGVCEAICRNECEPGQRRCEGNRLVICGEFDEDPCFEFGGGSPCARDEACQEGFCQVACNDECSEGVHRCADEFNRQTCGNFDEDGCREWSAPSGCALTERCTGAGQCTRRKAPAVLIHEVLYVGEGDDGADVFIELYGPGGTALRGLALVAIDGNGGQVDATIPLTGSIDQDGYYVLVHPQASAALQAVADQVSAAVDLENGPDSLQLRWGEQVVDALGYGSEAGAVFAGEGSPAQDVAAGQSLTRNAQHGDSGDNAVDFSPCEQPTPGRGSGGE